MELKNKRVLVVGLARTGVATALFCAARGAHVTATESRTEAQIGEPVAKLRAAGVKLELGGHQDKTFIEQDLIVPSPGVPADFSQLVAARKAGVKIWSEIELSYQFLNGSLVGITGSNGKTTTTALIEHILRGAGLPTQLAGNIGTPLISMVDQTKRNTVTVVELSSFQLELIDTFRPNVGLFLNLTPDHLDRHHTLKAYGDAKARIFENQTAEDAAILNADDVGAAAYAPPKPQVYWFSRKQRVAQGERVEDVRVENDLERRGDHPVRAELLQIGIAPDVFAMRSQRVEGRLALLISLLLEREDVLDAHPPMLAGLRVGKLARVEQPDEVLARHVEEVGRLLRRELLAGRDDGDRIAAGQNLGVQFFALAELQPFADADLAPRTHQTFPLVGFARNLPR